MDRAHSVLTRFAPEAFFAASACSWMPHWACHYYKLETGATFVVGAWSFSRIDSLIAIGLYTLLVVVNLAAVVTPRMRMGVGIASGTLHVAFAVLHAFRVISPFRFEVLGYPWSMAASARETVIVGLFGIASITAGIAYGKRLALPSHLGTNGPGHEPGIAGDEARR